MMQRKNNKRSKPYKHLTAVQKQSICKCKKDNPDISGKELWGRQDNDTEYYFPVKKMARY